MSKPTTWIWQLLRAGSFRLDGGSMFGVVPKPIWSKMVQPDELNRIPLQTNCLLLERSAVSNQRSAKVPTEFVLIETGFGGKWTDKERGFYEIERRTIVDALREVKVTPEQINHVIVTHLHFDHAAGLTSLDSAHQPVPTFPNATVHVQAREWHDALANKSTMTRTYLRDHLDPIKHQVKLVEGEAEILPGIVAWPMPGHTWGQQAVRFDDGKGIVCFAGDVLPTVHHVGLPFSLSYDMEPYTSMLSKKALLGRANFEDWRLVLDHEPGHAVLRVRLDPARPDRHELAPAN
jgi:glyoxylase-like metal-dependent hydrolase (beta-lactamase superfamily II)